MSDWNTKIIEEFRANNGKVGGPFEGGTLLLLTTTGAKSGKSHTTPLAYWADGERYIIIASYAGAPKHPAWYHNLLANPGATIEVGTEKFEVQAIDVKGEERDRLFQRTTELMPGFADYQKKTSRLIPVVALKRAS